MRRRSGRRSERKIKKKNSPVSSLVPVFFRRMPIHKLRLWSCICTRACGGKTGRFGSEPCKTLPSRSIHSAEASVGAASSCATGELFAAHLSCLRYQGGRQNTTNSTTHARSAAQYIPSVASHLSWDGRTLCAVETQNPTSTLKKKRQRKFILHMCILPAACYLFSRWSAPTRAQTPSASQTSRRRQPASRTPR